MVDNEFLDINLIRELQKDNTWWSNNQIPEEMNKKFRRSDFFKYKEVLDSRNIQVIIGPRRVGKTILIYQLINYLIKERKIESNRILYLDLGKPYIAFNVGGIEACLKIYQESILKNDFADLNEKTRIYVFIDEIQKQKEWAVILESYRSRYKDVSFMVTGSSGTELDKSASESLVGRANYRYILPLKFRDIVRIEMKYNEKKLLEVKDITVEFQKCIESKNIKDFYDYVIQLITTSLTTKFEIKVKNILTSYLLKGGYPEFYEEYKYNHWYLMSKRMRDDYFERIISRDVVEAFRVNRPDIIRKTYLLVAFDTSNIANFSKYASIIGTRKNTIIDYFNYLNKSFLVTASEKYHLKKRPKGEQKKVYVTDIGMRNAVLGITKSDIGSINASLGAMLETVVHLHCMRLKFRLHPTEEFNLNYWKEKKNEVDIIIDLNKIIIPIEVKYRERIDPEDKSSIKEFLQEYKEKSPFGIIVTKNLLALEGNILMIPAWIFLLIC